MIYYTIDTELLTALIDEEVSKIADEAYGDNGMSLYDSVVLTDKDADMVDRFIDAATNAFVSRTFDICKFTSDDTDGNTRLLFYVPDFDETMEDAAFSEISHFIVFSTCAAICKERRAQAEPEYAERAQAALEKAVILLKSRKNPTAIW